MARGPKLSARASAIALLPERAPPGTGMILPMSPLCCMLREAETIGAGETSTPSAPLPQAPPADHNAAHRDDQSSQRQQPHHDVPRRTVAKQQRKIETVERVEQPAVGAPAVVGAAQNIARRGGDVKTGVGAIVESCPQ